MRRPGRDEWLKLVEEYRKAQSEGVSQKEFCAKYDVSLSTLQFWLYRRSKQTSVSKSDSTPAFLPIEVVASPAPQARAGREVEVALRNGTVVRFAEGTDTRYLAELVAAIG